MTTWGFVNSSRLNCPDLVIGELFVAKRFEFTGRNEVGDLKTYSCVNRRFGCPSTAAIGTSSDSTDSQGWPLVVQHLFSHTPHSELCIKTPRIGLPEEKARKKENIVEDIDLENLAL